MTEHLVLIGDVIRSRQIADRDAFEGRLRETLTAVNRRFADELDAKASVLKGVDEIGAVLQRPDAAYDVVNRILSGVFPQQIRIVIVRGTIDVNLDSEFVAEMDGDAFHRADQHMDRIASEDLLFWADVTGDDELLSMLVNAVLTLRHQWTERQHEVVRAYEREGSQRGAAQSLEISQSAVSQTIRKTNYKRITSMENTITSVLEQYDE
jgi:hypothetical protein